ncbi:MAG TPA: PsbP-related protein [Anaerolineales bacterium]|nr:PsbP-related protein [Anaerolineales bacterium]
MKSTILPFITFAVLLSACAAPRTPQPIETIIPTEAIAPTAEPTQPVAATEPEPSPTTGTTQEMATYTDDLAGFSLDYPAGWFVDDTALANAEESFAYAISIASWDINNPPTPGGKDLNTMPEGATKIDVAVTKQAMTLEEAVAQQAENESGSPILGREDVILAGGLPAVILDVEGFAGLTRTLITVLNGNVIYVSAFGNLENFESIALTLRGN